MTVSGTTVFQDTFDLLTIIEEAFELVGVEVRNGYDIKTARRSLDLLMREWSNRGVNFWTIEGSSAAVTAGTHTVTLSSNVIDILEAAWRTTGDNWQQDRALTRISVTEYAKIANKAQTGMPSQFWVRRLITPTVTIWPVPTESATLLYWYLKQIDDTGAYTNTMGVPPRFLPSLTHGLAYYLAMKTPSSEGRIPMLQAEYERQFQLASEEDRERASVRLVPDLS